MGILNITPDSFSDGGIYNSAIKAIDRAFDMIDEGANIIDIGGESTRPGASNVSYEDEYERVIPVLKELKRQNLNGTLISIDTSKPKIMHAAIDNGVDIINDVYALTKEGAIDVIKNSDVKVCLMHMQGNPQNMQHNIQYDDVVYDVANFLADRVKTCENSGIDISRVIIDPGIGFGKSLEHNLKLLNNLEELKKIGCEILVGVSRKSMLGKILDADVESRLIGSVTAAVVAYIRGANILRVHDVKETYQALKVASHIIMES